MPHSTLFFAALVVFLFALVSRRAEGGVLTAPMIFAGAGLLHGVFLLDLEGLAIGPEAMRGLAEITLAVTLFVDASRIDLGRLRRSHVAPIRLLLLALPLSMLLGAALALLLFPALGWWPALVLGIILAPTDAALGQAVVVDERVPVRVRQTLNVESGLNDGLAFPFLLIAASLAAGESGRSGSGWLSFLALQILVGPLVGALVGRAGAWLLGHAVARGLVDHAFLSLAGLSLVVLAWAGADPLGGNGFIAAFVCGATFGSTAREVLDEVRGFGEIEGELLSLVVFFLFGVLLLPDLGVALDWRHLLYAIASLTLVRMLPVALSLAGLGLDRSTLAFVGWFGPRGLASIIYLLLVSVEYAPPGLRDITTTVLLTVALSILLHGFSAMPLASRYARHLARLGHVRTEAERRAVAEFPPGRGARAPKEGTDGGRANDIGTDAGGADRDRGGGTLRETRQYPVGIIRTGSVPVRSASAATTRSAGVGTDGKAAMSKTRDGTKRGGADELVASGEGVEEMTAVEDVAPMPRDVFAQAALDYHRYPTPGKLEISATKNMVNQRDLALAYSPGVAVACTAIEQDPQEAATLTVRSNLVAVITNGTAVLGLGAIGALASKPVMEGKAVLFKKFANVDVFDLELDTRDVDRFVDAVALLEPTFGGINLEDIKAPECFEIERRLRERMNIPVFHDDQHGTAIVVAAAIRNGLRVAGKSLEEVRLVCSGAGAAALACLNLLVFMGLKKEHVTVCDIHGVVYAGRKELMDPYKSVYARETDARTLDEVIGEADIFLGLSAPNVLKAAQVARMAPRPFILALANPDPEIRPEEVHAVRDDAIVATGRSDHPNQVNNVLCFPFLFRGALDVGATEINGEMQAAAVEAIADIATREASDVVRAAYGGKPFRFGRDYLIPKPFDPRLLIEIPQRVARAAMDSGVATRPIEDFDAYRRRLSSYIIRSGLTMKPVFERAQADVQRVVLAEGESPRVLNAAQVLVDDGICRPLLLGRADSIARGIEELGLRLVPGQGFDVLDPADNPDFERHTAVYHALMGRAGVSPEYAASVVRTRPTALGAVLVREGEADALICGAQGAYARHLRYLCDIIGIRDDVSDISALMLMILDKGTVFLTDTHVTVEPSAEEVAETGAMAAAVVRRFGMEPKVALLSHSNFGSRDNAAAKKMRRARELLAARCPELAVEGEMHADAALSEETRARIFPQASFGGSANLMLMPSLDAANITYNMLKVLGNGLPVGPMLMGLNRPAHIVTESTTVRGIVNLTAIAAADAIEWKREHGLAASAAVPARA